MDEFYRRRKHYSRLTFCGLLDFIGLTLLPGLMSFPAWLPADGFIYQALTLGGLVSAAFGLGGQFEQKAIAASPEEPDESRRPEVGVAEEPEV